MCQLVKNITDSLYYHWFLFKICNQVWFGKRIISWKMNDEWHMICSEFITNDINLIWLTITHIASGKLVTSSGKWFIAEDASPLAPPPLNPPIFLFLADRRALPLLICCRRKKTEFTIFQQYMKILMEHSSWHSFFFLSYIKTIDQRHLEWSPPCQTKCEQ